MEKYKKITDVLYIISLVLAIVISFSASFFYAREFFSSFGEDFEINVKAKIVIGESSFFMDVADSDEKREAGLSGRQPLCAKCGMLFIFDTEEKWGIWMKNMNFPIDLIWLDSEGKVTALEENLQPDSYPKIFYSPNKTKYAVEISAGTIKKVGIKKGDLMDKL